MFRKQLAGMAGAIVAWVTLALIWMERAAFAGYGPPSNSPRDRLDYALTWLLLPGLSLLIGVIGASRRGFYKDAIDGTRTPASPALEINLRYNQNTVEQVLLAAIAWIGLALRLPQDMMFLFPVLAVVFLAGRIAFFVGYMITPIGRAYGMVLTVFPTLLAYLWLTWELVRYSN